jgi:hypothetical protein
VNLKTVTNLLTKVTTRKDTQKKKAYENNLDQEKLDRNIQAAREGLADRNLTMCQRSEYERALEHLEKYKK